MTESKLSHIKDAEFEHEVIKSGVPVLVDFWAPWCGPCQMIAPMLEELSQEYGSRVKIVKMNVDENPATPSHFAIRAIPTLILFKSGQVVERITGVIPLEQLKAKLGNMT